MVTLKQSTVEGQTVLKRRGSTSYIYKYKISGTMLQDHSEGGGTNQTSDVWPISGEELLYWVTRDAVFNYYGILCIP
jgi:hypothetical protein